MKGWTAGASTSPPARSAPAQGASTRPAIHARTASSLAKHRQLSALQFKLADMATELVAARQMVRPGRQQTRRRVRATPPPTAPWPNALPPMQALTW